MARLLPAISIRSMMQPVFRVVRVVGFVLGLATNSPLVSAQADGGPQGEQREAGSKPDADRATTSGGHPGAKCIDAVGAASLLRRHRWRNHVRDVMRMVPCARGARCRTWAEARRDEAQRRVYH